MIVSWVMHEIFLNAETIFFIGGFPITNTLLMSLAAVLVLVLGGAWLKGRLTLRPGNAQSIVEVAYEALLEFMDSVLGERSKSEKYLPFVATIFVFILVSNWLGILPGVGSFGFFENSNGHHTFTPLLRSPASDLNFTLALAILTGIAVNAFGIAAVGVRAHAAKFFNFSGPIPFFIGILELVSEIARMISFAFRLFGNVFAGEVLLVVIAFLLPYAAPVPFFLLEIFVGFIQAFVFAMLALVFIAIATTEHSTEHG